MRRVFFLLGAIIIITVLFRVAISRRTLSTTVNPPSSDTTLLEVDTSGRDHAPFRRQYPDSIQRNAINRDPMADPQTPAWNAITVKALTDAGWTQQALGRVIALNADWFAILERDAPDAFSDQLRCLKRLGNRPQVLDFLKTFPETAGLLATADDPEELVEILDTDDAKRTLLMGLFVRYLGRREITALATALKGNRDLICRLIERGLVGTEVLFIFPRTGLGASDYEKWLQDNITTGLAGSDEDLASFIQFALLQGRDLLDQLNTDESFRTQFRTELWPKLLRVVNRKDEALEFYMDAPDLWRLLALEDGEVLLERRGMLAAALLFGPNAYPKELQPRVIHILLSGDGITFQALTEGKFRKDPLFHKLLERPLTGPVLAAALNKLFEQGTNYRPLLEKYNRLTNEVLAEEVGPPPMGIQTWLPFYTHYMIARKLWQGRDPSTQEWVEAGVDTTLEVATLIFPAAKGGKLVTQTVKNAGRKAGEKELARETAELGIKAAQKKLSNEAVEQLTKAGMEGQARKWAVTQALTEMQRSYRSMMQAIEKATSFEITDPVKFFYQHSNFGRESYKRLTNLEARVFMRGDGKVFVHVDRLAYAQVKRFLNEMFKIKAKEVITEVDEAQNWQRHVAAWWLLNTGDQAVFPTK